MIFRSFGSFLLSFLVVVWCYCLPRGACRLLFVGCWLVIVVCWSFACLYHYLFACLIVVRCSFFLSCVVCCLLVVDLHLLFVGYCLLIVLRVGFMCFFPY